jgi:site-specific recombinase XerD
LDTIADLLPSWERHLRARNLASRTIHSYLDAARRLDHWIGDGTAAPTPLDGLRHSDVSSYIESILDRSSASYAATHYRRLQQFFRWLVDEGELDDNPMRRLAPPKVPDKPVPVLTEPTVRALLAAADGKTFEQRRDTAILRVLLDCGVRAGELTGMRVDDVDFDYQVITVLGKGRRLRSVPFGAKTSQALDRYLRVRRRHQHAELPVLWVGVKGPLTSSGVQQMVNRLCRRAGVGHVHLHQFRHTAASEWLALGGQEGDLERLMGWSKSSGMTRRYGASAADQRARDSHRRLAPGDRY